MKITDLPIEEQRMHYQQWLDYDPMDWWTYPDMVLASISAEIERLGGVFSPRESLIDYEAKTHKIVYSFPPDHKTQEQVRPILDALIRKELEIAFAQREAYRTFEYFIFHELASENEYL